eukprot:3987969-Prymnesium_polylepis.1
MRPGALGNPFPMRGNEAQCDPVCAAHAAALQHALSGSEPDLYAIGRECGALALRRCRGTRGRLRRGCTS